MIVTSVNNIGNYANNNEIIIIKCHTLNFVQMRRFEDELKEKEDIIRNLKEKFIIGGMAEKKAKVCVYIYLFM